MDGSTTYLPARGNTSVGFYQVNAILLSSNWQVLEERVTSSVGGIGLNIINTFQMVAEDNGQYAMAQNSAAIESQRGGSYSSPSSRSETRSSCSKCHGTGVDPNYLKYWGGRQSWLGYYNKVVTNARIAVITQNTIIVDVRIVMYLRTNLNI